MKTEGDEIRLNAEEQHFGNGFPQTFHKEVERQIVSRDDEKFRNAGFINQTYFARCEAHVRGIDNDNSLRRKRLYFVRHILRCRAAVNDLPSCGRACG